MLLWLLALAGLILYAAFTAHLSLLALADPYQLDYGEGLVLHQAQLLAQGQSIYKGIDSYPYIFSNYPPLFQSLVSPLASLLGPSFLPGRLLTILATCGLALILYSIVRRCGGRTLPAAIASLLFVGSPYIYHWAPLFRIDLPALLLSTLGILVLWRATRACPAVSGTPVVATPRRQESSLSTPRPQSIYLAALLFVLSLYTKQSYIAAPAAGILFLALRNRKEAARLLLSMVVFGLVPFAVIQVITNGAFAFGLFTANVNTFSLALLAGQVCDFVATFAVIIALAAAAAWPAIARSLRLPGPPSPHLSLSLLDCYLMAALATILLAGKVGAWENYFFEALFMLCVYAGLGIERLLNDKNAAVRLFLPLCVIAQLTLMWHDPGIGVRVVREDVEANRALAPLIARQDGMILSEDLGLLLVNNKEIPYFSFQYAQLAEMGRWDQKWELDNLRDGFFSLVILEKGTREDPDKYQRFTRQVLSAVDTEYGLAGEVGKYRVYSPLPMLRPMDVNFGGQIALLGYRLDAPAPQTGRITIPAPVAALPVLNPYPAKLRLTLLWQARAALAKSYKVFVHLEDADGVRRAQSDAVPFFGLYPTQRWAEGEIVRDYVDIALPPGLAPGRYSVRLGLYDPASGQRLALAGGDSLYLASLWLGQPAPVAPPTTGAAFSFSGGITLTGYDLPVARLAAGMPLTVTLHWQTSQYIDRNYTVFVHLAAASGPPLAQTDSPPQQGALPTSVWNPGEEISDVHTLSIARDLPAGVYRLLVGLYDPTTARRVPLAGGADSAVLGDIQIVR